MTTADMRRTAANLAAVFCRTDRCVSAHKAIYDAMVRSRESGYAAGLARGPGICQALGTSKELRAAGEGPVG
jgi:hypothetical protein